MRDITELDLAKVSGGEVGATGAGDNLSYTGSSTSPNVSMACGMLGASAGIATSMVVTGGCLFATDGAAGPACSTAGSAAGGLAGSAVSGSCSGILGKLEIYQSTPLGK